MRECVGIGCQRVLNGLIWRSCRRWFGATRMEMMMYTLYYAAGTCALATHIALEEVGATYQAKRLNFAAGEQRNPDYLKINPKGRVPALVSERGALTETPALLAFIAQQYPAAKLAPLDDAFAFARVQEFNSYLCSTVHVAHAHKTRGTRWADDAAAIASMKQKVPETMTACAELIEREMIRGPWVMGEAYTICDPYLFTVARWLEGDNVDMSRLPRINAHLARMEQRPAVIRALDMQR
jgi:glutathione S-transferase